jgi:hypothetical protein
MNLLNENHRGCTELDPVCTENSDANLNSETRFRSERDDFGPVVADSGSWEAENGDTRERRVCMLACGNKPGERTFSAGHRDRNSVSFDTGNCLRSHL